MKKVLVCEDYAHASLWSSTSKGGLCIEAESGELPAVRTEWE